MVYLIAEFGQNHNGSMDTARRLIDAASVAGFDAVKGQKRCLCEECTPAEWRVNRHPNPENAYGGTYYQHRQALELCVEDHRSLMEYAKRKGLEYGLSCWSAHAVDSVDSLALDFLKVPSAKATDLEFVLHCACSNENVIVSTGAVGKDMLVHIAGQSISACSMALLQCTSLYPAEPGDMNLNVLDELADMKRRKLVDRIGLSAHCLNHAISAAAVAKGADVIEHHITLDCKGKGTDHAVSLEPDQMFQFVRDVRDIEAAMGTRDKTVLPGEMEIMRKLRPTQREGE